MKLAERVPRRGYQVLGLGFWQAWEMVSMCTDAIASDSATPYDMKTIIMIANVVGYLVVMAVGRFIPSLRGLKGSLVAAALALSLGSFVTMFVPYLTDAPLQLVALVAGVSSMAVGNALLLMMWGELWAVLTTGRVGQHLYLSFAFAFVLYFITYALPAPLDGLFACLLPVFSCLILKSCENEPVRRPLQHVLSWKDVPLARILLFVFALNVIWGVSQRVVPDLATAGNGDTFGFAPSMAVAGIAVGVFAAYLAIASPASEVIALYKPILPAMAGGFVLLALLPSGWGFIGNGFLTMGAYCLYMFVMLVATDLAFHTRTSTILVFGTAIVVSRGGMLAGSLATIPLKGMVGYDFMYPLAVACLGVLVLVGTLVYTQADLMKSYEAPRNLPLEDRPAKKEAAAGADSAVATDGAAATLAPAGADTAPGATSATDVPCAPHTPPPAAEEAAATPLSRRCARVAQEAGLTARETEVLELLVRGRTVQDVCDELFIAKGTAKHHVSNIYRKLGVGDRRSLYDIVEREEVSRGAD